jgi:hypothetical protein
MSSASMRSPSFPLPTMSSFLSTIFLPHSGVPSHCFTSYSTSLNPPTHNVGIIHVIRFYELSFSSSPFYELFSVNHFLFYSRRPHMHCFTSYSTSLNPPTPNVGIIYVIRFYELSFSSSPFYEFFSCRPFSLFTAGALTVFHLIFNIS